MKDELRRAFAASFSGHASTACPNSEDLWDAIELRLPVERRREVADHLAECSTCAESWRIALQMGATPQAPFPPPEKKLEAFEDPDQPGNGANYHTGKPCIEDGCTEPAGTAWSPLWCFRHNVERMRRISASLERMVDTMQSLAARCPHQEADMRCMLSEGHEGEHEYEEMEPL